VSARLVLACAVLLGCADASGGDEAGNGSSDESSSSSSTSTTLTSSSTEPITTTATPEDSGEAESSSGAPACDDGTGGADGYAALIEPIVAANCSCHRTGSPAGLSLRCGEGYFDLVEIASTEAEPLPRVLPGTIAQSYMWLKLTNQHLDVGGSGGRMPLNETPLSTEDLGTIRTWIEAGAPP
jgi:hypothetical protein